jgi:hypothetical protein
MPTSHTVTEAFLKELGADGMSSEQKAEISGLVEKRLNEVVLRVVLGELSSEEFQAFKTAMASPNPEEEIAKVTALVPGLAEKIEAMINTEMALMRAAMS